MREERIGKGVCVSRQAVVMGWTVEGAGRGFVFRQAVRVLGEGVEGAGRGERFSAGWKRKSNIGRY